MTERAKDISEERRERGIATVVVPRRGPAPTEPPADAWLETFGMFANDELIDEILDAGGQRRRSASPQ